jgi:hypothetical protein
MQALAIGSSSASVNRKASLGVTSSIANGATLSGTV